MFGIHNIVNTDGNAVFITDSDGRIIFWNKGSEILFGKSFDDVKNTIFLELIQPLKKNFEKKNLIDIIKSNQRWSNEFVINSKQGKKQKIILSFSVSTGQENEFDGILATALPLEALKDINQFENEKDRLERPAKHSSEVHINLSKLQESVKELKISRERYKVLIDNMNLMVSELDERANYTFVSDNYYEHLGYRSKDLLGKPAPNIIHPDDREKAGAQIIKAIPEERPISGVWRAFHKNGQIVHLQCHISFYRNSEGLLRILVVSNDITEKTLAEEIISKEAIQQKLIIERNPVPMVIIDRDQNILSINRKFTETYGYTLEDFITLEQWWKLAFPGETYRGKVVAGWNSFLKNPVTRDDEIVKHIWEMQCKDGRSKSSEFQYVPMGNIFLVTAIDLTNILSTQRALSEREQTFRNLFSYSQAGIIYIDSKGEVLQVNPKFRELVNIDDEKSIIQKNIFNSYFLKETKILKEIKKCIATGELYHDDTILTLLPGDTKYVNVYIAAVRTNGKIQGVLVSIYDETEKILSKQKLEESEEKLRLSLKAAKHGIFEIDYLNETSSMNQEFFEYLGYQYDPGITYKKGWPDLIHPDDLAGTQAGLYEFLEKDEKVFSVEYRIRKKNGEYIWLLSRGEKVFKAGNKDKPIILGILTDITQLKEYQDKILKQKNEIESQNSKLSTLNKKLQSNLEETSRINADLKKLSNDLKMSEGHAKQLLEETRQRNSEISMLLAGSREILESEDFNKTAYKLFSQCKKVTGADSGYLAFLDRNSNKLRVLFYEIEDKKSRKSDSLKLSVQGLKMEVFKNQEITLVNDFHKSVWQKGLPPGHYKIENILLAPLVISKETVGLIVMANKKNGFKEADKNIVGAFAELTALAFHNSEVLENLRKAKERAEESDQLKSAFLSNMSHEIRTPMNAILGFSDLLRNKDIDFEKRERFSQLIHASSEQLLLLINDIIDISKIESNQMAIDLEWIHLAPFMEEVNLSLQQTRIFKESKSILEYVPGKDDNDFIYADRHRLMQVFNNLLTNALKFTSMGYVEFGYDKLKQNTKEYYKFYVKDTGVGIPETSKENIFKRFVQAKNQHFVQKGTGLGLSITQGLVRAMGGDIWVESEPGKGSIFYFTIPVPVVRFKQKKSSTKIDETRLPSLKEYSLFVAEDDIPSLMYIEELLERTEIQISHFINGQDLVNAVIENIPDLILMDISMPVKNGLDATKEIRSRGIQVPIIAQTAYAMANERDDCIESGCDEYITKPIRAEELFSKIIELLGL